MLLIAHRQFTHTHNEDNKVFNRSDATQSDPPGALKEAEGGEVIRRFEEVGFGRSFVDDAETVELHAAADSLLVTQSLQIRSHSPGDLIWKMTQAQSHESIIPYPAQSASFPANNNEAKETWVKFSCQVLAYKWKVAALLLANKLIEYCWQFSSLALTVYLQATTIWLTDNEQYKLTTGWWPNS